MPNLHSASHSKAQCSIIGLNFTTHLGLPSSALKVSDALFKSLKWFAHHFGSISSFQALGDAHARLPACTPSQLSCVCPCAPNVPCMHACTCMNVRTSPAFACSRLCPSARLRAPACSRSLAYAFVRMFEPLSRPCTPEHALPCIPARPNV
ncbi:hypothetical protein CRG98_015696 [Punica granatum]|uniref:Uncharacterized protein n=1 Tax=Punica granatum TaxID=22663 RepID=A0A2I0K5V0_PUNGR|nr:hypothetical protein CRG98_015696 [Punica granatum]